MVMSKLGSCTVAKVSDAEELGAVLPEAVHESETVIVKPNFADRAPGTYTDPESLRMLFEAIGSRIVVVEGHQLVRVLSEGESGVPGFRYNLHRGLCVVGVGTDRVELDTVMCGLG